MINMETKQLPISVKNLLDSYGYFNHEVSEITPTFKSWMCTSENGRAFFIHYSRLGWWCTHMAYELDVPVKKLHTYINNFMKLAGHKKI